MQNSNKIVLPGGAGLVGQNLVRRLREKGYANIVVLDKNQTGLLALKKANPDATVQYADLSTPGDWRKHFIGADTVVMLQAQIGGNDYQEFVRNNLDSTRLILDSIIANNVPYLVHVSSSVVESVAEDFYTKTKQEQERMVLDSGISCPVLRPTLMFGMFDRKHLGWLAAFMRKMPIFPIPGNGNYMRQPLYVGDFCSIVVNCMEKRIKNGVYNISGREPVFFIDIIREIKRATGARTLIVKTPYRLFYWLLGVWGVFDRNPPFTRQQLAALVAGDRFEV